MYSRKYGSGYFSGGGGGKIFVDARICSDLWSKKLWSGQV